MGADVRQVHREMKANEGSDAKNTLFGPESHQARAIDWDQGDCGLHQGAQSPCSDSDAVYMAATKMTAASSEKTLPRGSPSIHGPSDNDGSSKGARRRERKAEQAARRRHVGHFGSERLAWKIVTPAAKRQAVAHLAPGHRLWLPAMAGIVLLPELAVAQKA
jgi:hypothetical protein